MWGQSANPPLMPGGNPVPSQPLGLGPLARSGPESSRTTHLLPLAFSLSPTPRRGSPPAGGEQLPARPEETCALHQSAAEGAREGVRGQQVHYQREAPAHLRHHEPLGAPGHHLVPESAGQREEGGQQVEGASSALHLTARPPRPCLFMSPLCTITEPTEGRFVGADEDLMLTRKRNRARWEAESIGGHALKPPTRTPILNPLPHPGGTYPASTALEVGR